jgi:hypothetical protein
MITFPPNSNIALASATLNQNLDDNRITIPADQYIYLRYDGQNIIRLQPNPGVLTHYTKQEFVDRMNALIPASKPYGSDIVFELDAADDILIKFYTEANYDYDIDFMTQIYGANNRPASFVKSRDPVLNADRAFFRDIQTIIGTVSQSSPIQFQTTMSLGLTTQHSINITDPAQELYVQTAGISRAFNRAKVFDWQDDLENHIYDSFGVVFAPQNAAAPFESNQNMWMINWGVSQYDRANNAYNGIPFDVLNGAKPYKESLELKGDFTSSLYIFNNQTNAFEITNKTWLPGDTFRHYLTLANQGGLVPNDAALYNPIWRQDSYNGMVFSCVGNLNHVPNAPDRQYNTLELLHEPASGFLEDQADFEATDADFITRMGFDDATQNTPCNKAMGVHSGWGQNEAGSNLQNITPIFKAIKSIAVTVLNSETESSFNNLPLLNRRDPSDGNGADQSLLGRLSFTGGIITSGESAACSFYCRPVDDSAYNTGTQQQILRVVAGKHDNNTQSSVVDIAMNNSEAWDIRISSRNNTQVPVNFTPLDGTGARINLAWGDRLGVVVSYTKGDTLLKVSIWKINAAFNTATHYTASQVVAPATYEGLNNATGFGPKEDESGPTTVASEGFNGVVGHFRWYNFPAAMTEPTLPTSDVGDPFYEALGKQWNAAWDNDISVNAPSTDLIFASADPKYAVTGNRFQSDPDEEETNNYCPIFANYMGTPNANRHTNANYPDIVDIYNIPNIMLPFAANYKGVDNLDASVYTGNGGGIVDTGSYALFLDVKNEDAANRRDVEPYTWYLPGIANPWNEITMDGVSTFILNQAIRIHIENFPHRTLNGTTGNFSKAIYEIQSDADKKVDNESKTMTMTVPERIKIPLDNVGPLLTNQFDVLLTDQDDKELTNIKDHTSITITID